MTTDEKTFEVNLPFSGFYESIHDAQFDREHESELENYESEAGEALPDCVADLWYDIDWRASREAYAKAFTDGLLAELDIHGEFSGMTSPREYNFETDRIYCKINRAALLGILYLTDPADMDEVAAARHTSRSGFISFYSPDWRTWGDVEDWDEVHLGTLVRAYIVTTRGEIDETQIIDDCYLYEVDKFLTCDNAARFFKLAYYMRQRAKRSIRTWAGMIAAMRAENRPFNSTPLGAAGEA